MRVLMTNHSLGGVGGTEKWTYATAKELTRRGHEVTAYAFSLGATSERMAPFATVTDKLEALAGVPFDLKLTNHATTCHLVKDLPGFHIHTSHGPGNPLEFPPGGADVYVGVSEEVRDTMWERVHRRLEVIPNGIDLQEFRPGAFTAVGTPRVLSMCKSVATTWMMDDACKALGWEHQWYHYTQRPAWSVADAMRMADIVVGCGRTAREGLACDKSVLVFDGRQDEPLADGWVTEDNVDELATRNFACRTRHEYWSIDRLIDELGKWERPATDWARQWAEIHADIVTTVNCYLSLIEPAAHAPDLTAEYEGVYA
jgi:hypothetical protein